MAELKLGPPKDKNSQIRTLPLPCTNLCPSNAAAIIEMYRDVTASVTRPNS
jgi:hypothetical protein